mmetsp:Transcript_18018/g.49989  ORF Transcript_18018/g.49989 Transcript_18018/m.49989 type:complete len:226 (-) Transcript_18018:401-1078(-)
MTGSDVHMVCRDESGKSCCNIQSQTLASRGIIILVHPATPQQRGQQQRGCERISSPIRVDRSVRWQQGRRHHGAAPGPSGWQCRTCSKPSRIVTGNVAPLLATRHGDDGDAAFEEEIRGLDDELFILRFRVVGALQLAPSEDLQFIMIHVQQIRVLQCLPDDLILLETLHVAQTILHLHFFLRRRRNTVQIQSDHTSVQKALPCGGDDFDQPLSLHHGEQMRVSE